MTVAPEVTANAANVEPSSSTTSVTPNGTAWANSSWFQVIASTSGALTLVGLNVSENATSVDYEFDVGVGGAGAEVVIATLASNIPATTVGSAWRLLETRIPIDNIPNGSRVAVRMRKSGTSTAIWSIQLVYYQSVGGSIGVTTNPTLVVPAAAVGVTVATDTGSGTRSAWVELSPALTDIFLLAVICKLPAVDDWQIDIGTGGAGSEVVVGSTGVNQHTATGPRRVIPFCIPIKVAGTNRISVSVFRGTAAASVNCTFKLLYMSTSGFAASSVVRSTAAIPAVTSDAAALTSLTPNAGSWVNSAWVQLIASTATAIVVTGITVDPAGVACSWEIDVGVGGAGSEAVIGTLGDFTFSFVGEDNTIYFPIPIDAVPVSSRVAVRLRKSGTNTTAWGVGLEYVPKSL